MFKRILSLTVAIMLSSISVDAQERGTIEFGGFASWNQFDGALQMDDALGFGGRLGAYLDPRWVIEFDVNGGTAKRPLGLADRSFMMLDARLAFIPVTVGRASLILGGGASHVDANVGGPFQSQNFGYHALAGGKIALTPTSALRLDYVRYFNDGAQHGSVRAGLALARRPMGHSSTDTVVRMSAAPMRSDSVSAAETRRLRDQERMYVALRDSLARRPAPSNAAALATMLEMVHFERDQSNLDAVARAILDDKVPIFNANPQMKIVITGYASMPGTEVYNMALGLRRAEAARDYLVARGIATNRIEIATRGEKDLLVEGPGDVANAANRRGQFRLLIANYYLTTPR
jgi:outer membrane protein OmpA-like peptidoglycan-associated protein